MGSAAHAPEPDDLPWVDPFSEAAGAAAAAGDEAVVRSRTQGSKAQRAAEPRPKAYSRTLETELAEQAQRHALENRQADHVSHGVYRERADRRHKHVTFLIILSLWIGFLTSSTVLVFAAWLFVSGSAHGQLIGGVLLGGGGVASGTVVPRMARYVRVVRGRRKKLREGSDQT